jgi:hypothetical protein
MAGDRAGMPGPEWFRDHPRFDRPSGIADRADHGQMAQAQRQSLFDEHRHISPGRGREAWTMHDAPISEEDLTAIRARLDAAAPGPWRSMVEGRDHTSGDNFIMIGEGANRSDDMHVYRDKTPADVADQDFIAHARQDIPRLLEEIDRLRAMNHR